MELTFITIIMCMRVLQSVFSKKAAMLIPKGIKSYILYIATSQFIAAAYSAVLLASSGDFSGCDGTTILLAACSGSFLAINSLCSVKALLGGTLVLNSIFSTAGLIVPCVLGIFVFDETLSAISLLCIAVVLVGAVLLIDSSKEATGEFSAKTLFYLVMSFFSNGMVMFFQKLFGECNPNGNVSMFSMLTFLIPAMALSCVLLVKKSKNEKLEKFPKMLMVYIMILGFAVFVIQQTVTMLTPVMSAAVLFTIVNGGATVIAAIVGAILYKEKITIKSAVGLLLAIGALIVIKTQ